MSFVWGGLALAGLGVGAWGLLRAGSARRERDEALAARAEETAQGMADRTRIQLLEAVLDAAPLAVVLCDGEDRVVLANRTASDLFFGGTHLIGAQFDAVLERCPPGMARAIRNRADVLFTVSGADAAEEAYHLSRPAVEIDLQPHTLYLITELTRELNRQEVAIWKKMIRVVSHELNNSVTPISSLLHSARLVVGKPEHADRVVRILDTIDECVGHLHAFIEGYARFARLAPPTKARVSWAPFLASIVELFDCELTGTPPEAPGHFDAAQIQQALINLLKNAREAGGPADAIELNVESTPRGTRLAVRDAGLGMSEQMLKQALLPFYSTKDRGTGIGLTLCREIIEAHGGTIRLVPQTPTGLAVELLIP